MSAWDQSQFGLTVNARVTNNESGTRSGIFTLTVVDLNMRTLAALRSYCATREEWPRASSVALRWR